MIYVECVKLKMRRGTSIFKLHGVCLNLEVGANKLGRNTALDRILCRLVENNLLSQQGAKILGEDEDYCLHTLVHLEI